MRGLLAVRGGFAAGALRIWLEGLSESVGCGANEGMVLERCE